MKKTLLFLSVFLCACSGLKKLNPEPVREAQPLLFRGWAYIESEKESFRETGSTPTSFSGIVSSGDKVYFGSERFGLMALNKFNGKKIWQHRFRDGISSSPLLLQDKLYIGTDAASFHAFSAASGKELWQVPLSAPAIGQPILVEGKIISATADESLMALDPATGKQLWLYKRPGFSGTSIRGGGNPSFWNGRIWMGFSDGSLLALNPNDGSVLFEKQFRDNLKFMDIDAKVLGYKEGILVNSYDGKLRYLRADGNIIWEFSAGGARSPTVLENKEALILPSSDGSLYSLRMEAGSVKELWRFYLRRGVPTAVLVNEKDGLVFAASSEDKLYVLDLVSGKQLAEQRIGRGSGSYASSLLEDKDTNSFYLLSSFSRVFQFRLNTGTKR